MAAVIICSDFGAPKNKVWHWHCFHVSPSISHEVMGPDAMIFVFWMLSFKPTFSRSTFTFTKRLFSSSSLSLIYSDILWNIVFSYFIKFPALPFLCMLILVNYIKKIFYNVVLVFCHTTMQVSHNYTFIPSLLAALPSPHPIPPGHHRAPDWAPCAT